VAKSTISPATDVLSAIEAIEEAQRQYETALDAPCSCGMPFFDETNCPGCNAATLGSSLVSKALRLLGVEPS